MLERNQIFYLFIQFYSLSHNNDNDNIKLRDVSLRFGDNKMLSDFSYDFNAGDRIGIGTWF